jgi:hypothetical protein
MDWRTCRIPPVPLGVCKAQGRQARAVHVHAGACEGVPAEVLLVYLLFEAHSCIVGVLQHLQISDVTPGRRLSAAAPPLCEPWSVAVPAFFTRTAAR